MFKVRGDHNKIECRIRYDRGEVMPLKGCADMYTVAGVLKLYLAEPLLTFRLYDSSSRGDDASEDRAVLALGSLLDSLDSAKRTLRRLRVSSKVSPASGRGRPRRPDGQPPSRDA